MTQLTPREQWDLLRRRETMFSQDVSLSLPSWDEMMRRQAEHDRTTAEALSPLFRPLGTLAPSVDGLPLDGLHLRPGKTTLLFGQPGTGKSWWALFRAMRIAASGQNVCWYDTEEGEDGFRERADLIMEGWAGIGATYTPPLDTLHYGSMERLFAKEDRLDAELSAINPVLIVVDTGVMAAGAAVDEIMVAAFWAALARAAPREACVLVVTHPNKADSPTAIGSQLWTSRSREIYEVKAERFGRSFTSTVSDTKLKMVPECSYSYTFGAGAVETELLAFESEGATRRLSYPELIHEALTNGALTGEDLWQAVVERDESRVKKTHQNHVSRLKKNGHLTTLPDGRVGLAQP